MQLTQLHTDTTFDTLAHQAYNWFQDNHHPHTGMVKDRTNNHTNQNNPTSSIAATGYHLSLLPYAAQRGWTTTTNAQQTTTKTLHFATTLQHHHGLLHHFTHWETGKPQKQSEYSLLDTTIFLNGCITASQAFPHTQNLANHLLNRVNWPKHLTNTKKPLLTLGWNNNKQLPPATNRSSEFAMAYFLATGSKTHPINPQTWYNTTITTNNICGHNILNPTHPLFTSNYGLSWANLRGLKDHQGIDLDHNAHQTALANRTYCHTTNKSTTYHKTNGGWWGLSAGDSPTGYTTSNPTHGSPTGTVWPMAALATIPWIPNELTEDLTNWQTSPIWNNITNKYGLSPFSLDHNWIGTDTIGIDLGSYALNWANHHHGTIWQLWMSHPTAQNALKRLGYI